MCIYWKAWIGNDDNEVEGVWETWYTDQVTFLPIAIPQPVEYQPWAQDRPYDDAPNHNCMLLKVIASLNPPSAVYLSSKYTYPLSSQMFQVNLEDSGTTLAKTRNPNMEDRECERAHLGCGICEVAAPVRRVNIRGLCDLSIFDRSIHTFQLHILNTWVILCFSYSHRKVLYT